MDTGPGIGTQKFRSMAVKIFTSCQASRRDASVSQADSTGLVEFQFSEITFGDSCLVSFGLCFLLAEPRHKTSCIIVAGFGYFRDTLLVYSKALICLLLYLIWHLFIYARDPSDPYAR